MTTAKLDHKIAIVTGASRGLGRAAAKRLAADGALVALGYKADADAAATLVEEIGRDKAFTVQGDLSSLAGVDEFYGRLDEALRERTSATRFDILLANAGVIANAPVAETDEATFDHLFDTNVKGVFFMIQRALGRIRDGGRIITLSSGLTRMAHPGYAAYSATKGAIDVLTLHLAAELGKRNITVNSIAPGAILTDMNPWLRTDEGRQMMSSITALGRVGMPDDIADAIAFLASDDSRWVTAQRLEASGGQGLL